MSEQLETTVEQVVGDEQDEQQEMEQNSENVVSSDNEVLDAINEEVAQSTIDPITNRVLAPLPGPFHHRCVICERHFANGGTLHRHIRDIHKEDPSPEGKEKCVLCGDLFRLMKQYHSHIGEKHDISLKQEKETFANFDGE